MSSTDSWYEISAAADVPTPALVFYPERIRANIREAVTVAGSAARLRPHVKTHKCPDVVGIMLDYGIERFKCATLAEAAMLARAGASDVLIAYPLVGPNPSLLCELIRAFPGVSFTATIDSDTTRRMLSDAAKAAGLVVEAALDIDVGMHRTGAASPTDAISLVLQIDADPNLAPGGIHAYDGHVHESDPQRRRELVATTIALVRELAGELRRRGVPVPRVTAGGTPTFPCYAAGAPEFELSPGTCFLHDWGYLRRYPDLAFDPAALILGRVISLTGDRRFTIDVGSKAIAADPPGERGTILNLPGSQPLGQSEEHWVFRAGDRVPEPGDLVYVLPAHICPSVALHDRALTVDGDGTMGEPWPITARERWRSEEMTR